MDQDTATTPSFKQLVLRGLRIAASTVALVELLRNDWTGGGLATLAWFVFTQVERRQNKHPS